MVKFNHHSSSLNSVGVQDAAHSAGTLNSCAVITRYRPGQAIESDDGESFHWYRVLSGVVSQYAVQADGRRQIIDLLLSGDCFGIRTQDDGLFAAEAVVDGTTLASYPRSRVQPVAEADPKIAEEVREIAYETIARLQRQLLVLGRVTALEKVGSFLLEMARRVSDKRTDEVLLPITRYDIADYLAVSVETVSRALTELQKRRVIALQSARQVRIIDRETLEDGCRRNERW